MSKEFIQFPKNPADGTVFEAAPGSYYEFNKALNSWRTISVPAIPVATRREPGLMSKEDFNKLTGLLIPPPITNLSVEADDCGPFTEGTTTIIGDDIVKVEHEVENLHENTATINFSIDINALADEMEKRGNIRFSAIQGDQGPAGKDGKDGADRLPTGPQGPDGVDGTNAVWPGVLSEERFETAQDDRAIVDITTEQVSADENYIVVKRGNIGNPDACPNTILPQDVNSPWLLGFANSCACDSGLFFFDVEALIETIRNHWIDFINAKKAEKEALATEWLNAMIAQYNEQKSALCCALEACQSKTRNQSTRQYIESQRIAAAAGDFRLIIGGEQDKITPPPDPNLGDCGWNIPPTNFNLINLSDPDCEIDWASLCPAS